MSSSRVDPISFVQINPENYQSRPPLPEDVPLAYTDSSVHLTSFILFWFEIAVGSLFDRSCIFFAGPSASRTASDVQERAADELAVESVRTQKRSSASAGSSDR